MSIVSKRAWRAAEKKRKIMVGAARANATGQLLQLSRGKTHYKLDGNPNDPLLICIHGWSTASYVWEPLRPYLLEKGYRVLTYDLYGRGFSDRPLVKNSAQLFTDQLEELLVALGLSGSRLNVIGYSMGGAIAARFVSQRLDLVDRLLLLAPAGMVVRFPIMRFVARHTPKVSDPLILSLLPRSLRKQFLSEADGLRGNDAVNRVVERQLRELDYRGYLPSLLSSLKGVLADDMAKEHRAIAGSNVAVRAIFADQDKTIPYPISKWLFDHWNQNGVSRTIKQAGHGVTYTHVHLIKQGTAGFL